MHLQYVPALAIEFCSKYLHTYIKEKIYNFTFKCWEVFLLNKNDFISWSETIKPCYILLVTYMASMKKGFDQTAKLPSMVFN